MLSALLVAVVLQTHLGEQDVYPFMAFPPDHSRGDRPFDAAGYGWARGCFAQDLGQLAPDKPHPGVPRMAATGRYDFKDLSLVFQDDDEGEAGTTVLLLYRRESVTAALATARPLLAADHLVVSGHPVRKGRTLTFTLVNPQLKAQHLELDASLTLTLDAGGRCVEVELDTAS